MLGEVLPATVYSFLLVFTRVGVMIMALPILGETAIPLRVRFAVAFALAVVIFPLVRDGLPGLPGSVFGLVFTLSAEVIIALMIAGSVRIIMTALHVGGSAIAFQGGLAVAQGFDPNVGGQSPMMSTFLTLLGVVAVFAANLHHLLIGAMYYSFIQFPAGSFPIPADFADLVVDIIAASFALGIQIAAPFLAYGLVFYLGVGLLSRLMPQLQVFFIAMPLNIALSFLILMLVIGAVMTWFLTHFEGMLVVFTG